MAEKWYVQSGNGDISGPLSEREVSADLLSGKISDTQRVRQGDSGPWCEAKRARAVFRQLSEVGWYIRSDDEVFGPFTDAKLLELHRTGDLAHDAELRQGVVGIWKSAAPLFAGWQAQTASQTIADAQMLGETSKWSVEPIRHVVMQVTIDDDSAPCLPLERLVLRPDEASSTLRVERSNGAIVGRLGESDSRQLIANSQRGVSHVVLYNPEANAPSVYVTICPPGTPPEACRAYIDQHFLAISRKHPTAKP